jgi:hypothetical protein
MQPHRKPRPVHLNAVQMAINRARKLAPADVAGHVALITTALATFMRGTDCAAHWRSLADTANVAETFAAMGICSGPDAQRVIEQAQAALYAVQMRHQQRGSWTLYAQEVEELTWLNALHAHQLRECTYGEFERALQTTRHRVAGARAGNAPAGALVITGDIA